MDALDSVLDDLRKAKQTYRALQTDADDAKRIHDVKQEAVFALMRERGLLTVKAEDASYSRKSTIYGHVQDRDAFVKWCKEREIDDDVLVLKERGQPLNEMVRAAIDNGEPLPDGVGFYAKEYISITESKE